MTRALQNSVLFLIFNRPELTERSFSVIKQVQPTQLFIAADGPRKNRPKEHALCQQTRQIVSNIDWPCDVKTLFREENLGCGDAVSSAINWFFEHVEAGIILEDDCIPHPTFFNYCSEMLDRYENEPRIMTITGARFKNPKSPRLSSSYDFSIYHHIWGWATWRRAWALYERHIELDSPTITPEYLTSLLHKPAMVSFWLKMIHHYQTGAVDTWDYPWLLTCWKHQGLSIRPKVNLISNQGFGPEATHTRKKDVTVDTLPLQRMIFPLSHPEAVTRNPQLEEESEYIFIPEPPAQTFTEKLRSFIRIKLFTPLNMGKKGEI